MIYYNCIFQIILYIILLYIKYIKRAREIYNYNISNILYFYILSSILIIFNCTRIIVDNSHLSHKCVEYIRNFVKFRDIFVLLIQSNKHQYIFFRLNSHKFIFI